MSRKDTWREQPTDAEHARIVVRCRGHRIIAVGHGEPAPVVPIRLGSEWGIVLDGTRLYDRGIGPGSGSLVRMARSYPCPSHRAGHVIDGGRLREVLDLQARPGKVISIDVSRVS
jgi:hypothetical protein